MKRIWIWIISIMIVLGMAFYYNVFLGTRPPTLHLLTSEEIFLNKQILQLIEQQTQTRIDLKVITNWAGLIDELKKKPSPDVLLLPSHWAESLAQQNLVRTFEGESLFDRISEDFKNAPPSSAEFFLPLFWLKTEIVTSDAGTLESFLKNKSQKNLRMFKDEDLLLAHFQLWEQEGLLSFVQQKNISLINLEELLKIRPSSELPSEAIIGEQTDNVESPQHRAFLVWGVSIAKNSENVRSAQEFVETYTLPEVQSLLLKNLKINTTLNKAEAPALQKANHLREIPLRETIQIKEHTPEASKILKERFKIPADLI